MARVLLINDEPDLLALFQLVLEDAGHTAETLTEGAKVIETVRRFHPDVICLDWVIPDLSGEEALRRLKTVPETRHIPVVVITALEGLDSHVLLLGAELLLHKPIRAPELVAAVDRALRSRPREAESVS